jgi:hypothetical protein
MCILTIFRRLSSACTVFFAPHGAVTQQAHKRHCSRQRLYREAQQVLHDLDPTAAQTPCLHLQEQLVAAQKQVHDLQQRLDQAVEVSTDCQAQFAALAQAQGVSLSASHALLAVLLGSRTPSRATLGRLAQAAAGRASAALAVLDAFSHARARHLAADEIYAGRRPVLMTVEQDSLCWLGGRLAAHRGAAEWAAEFEQLPQATQVSRDGAEGLRKGLQLANRRRAEQGQAAIADQEDHFHLLQQAWKALRAVRHKATAALHRADKAQKALQRERRQGRGSGALVMAVQRRWQQAEAAFDRWATQADAFGRLKAALRPFTPAGELKTPAQAQAETAAALAELTGPEWTRAKRRLAVAETFTFLDRVHAELEALPVPGVVVQAVVQAEGLRQQPAALRQENSQGAALRGVVLLTGVLLASWGPAGAEAVQAVRRVLAGLWRASSLVEGLNSVVRMQQARQKRLTQGLLDLKRLHWNLHCFAAGRRKGQSPYGRLGLVLPPGSWWELLNRPPEQLRLQMSALNPAA